MKEARGQVWAQWLGRQGLARGGRGQLWGSRVRWGGRGQLVETV